jgi:hypothetical protein
MSVVSTRQELSLPKIWSWRVLVAWCMFCISGLLVLRSIDHHHSSPSDKQKLVHVKDCGRETKLCLAAAHALVRLDDGTIVGDPMEKTTLEALDWQLAQGISIHHTFRPCLN